MRSMFVEYDDKTFKKAIRCILRQQSLKMTRKDFGCECKTIKE